MGDDDGPVRPVVLRPGLRYRIFQPCEPLEAMAQVTLGMLGHTVPFSLEGKLVGMARVVEADPAEDGSGIMFTCELISLEVN